MGISGFGSGIIMVLGWQVANMLREFLLALSKQCPHCMQCNNVFFTSNNVDVATGLDGAVPFAHVQVLLVAMALPTATFLTCRSWRSNAIDIPVCLTFGVFNLCFYAGGLLLLLNVLIQSPVVLKHALGYLFLLFALLRIASDYRIIPGSGSTELRPRGDHPPSLMFGWAITGSVSGAMSGIFGVGGPPTMLFMTMARMDKGAMRGTNQAGNIALQLVRIAMLLWTGVLKPTAPGVGLEVLALILAGITGAIIGDQLHGSVSDLAVVRIILVSVCQWSCSIPFLKASKLVATHGSCVPSLCFQ